MDGVVRGILDSTGAAAEWRLHASRQWVMAQPASAALRAQGWKLHVSSTSFRATEVLARAATVLVRHGCPFKFAATTADVRALNSRNADRGTSGKFLTVYPLDDADAPALAAELDEATRGLPGPEILSDRRYAPGSLVHYRYGGFRRVTALLDNGAYQPVITDSDGNLVPDRRDAWFAPPSWAPDPFRQAERGGQKPAKAVLVGDRFVVRGAIRHANKGGVFRAADQETGHDVVLKQGRAYVDELPDGGDVRDLLRHESRMLELLAHTGYVPTPVVLLDLGGHTFLAEETVEGVPLRVHVQRLRRAHDREGLLALADGLVQLVGTVHEAGVVIRDLSPANLVVAPDGRIRLVDLELAQVVGEPAVGAGTPGFAAPEQWAAASTPTPARVEADLFALGALLFTVAVGTEPVLARDDRPVWPRIRQWLDLAAADNPLLAELEPVISDLMRDDPAERRLRDRAPRLLTDGLDFLVTTMAGPEANRLWPGNAFAETTDPTNLYYGSAGVLGVLTAASRYDTTLLDAVGTVARWTADRCEAEPTALPGLHFGRSGPAWALLDAALALGDDDLLARAAKLAQGILVASPIPDVCHGLAGAGLTFLHFWRATGDNDFLSRAGQCAEALVTSEDAPLWSVPPQPPAFTTALRHYGFAHGTAGIAAFVLDHAQATGDSASLAVARQAADTLCSVAILDGDAARWSAGPAEHVPLSNWCSGSSGIGSYLIRAWTAFGDDRYLDFARAAAVAVRADQWTLPAVSCHGVPGNMDFLLDMADATGSPAYRDWAAQAVPALAARATVRDGRLLCPDDGGLDVVAGHHTGVAGVVAALLRLHRPHTPRLWLPPLNRTASGRASTK